MGVEPAWMRRGAAPTWRDIHIYIYLLYLIKGVFSLPYMGRFITPINRRVL